jgi:tetratricopeptide (TPR) repeat protein
LKEGRFVTKRHKTQKKRHKTPPKRTPTKRAFPARAKWLLGGFALMGFSGIGFFAYRSINDAERAFPSAARRSQSPITISKPESGPAVADASPDKEQAVEPGSAPDLSLEQRILAIKDEELQLAQELITAFPRNEEPLVLMGDVLRRRGETDEALGYWEKALAQNPGRADVYHKMAVLAFDTDAFERAILLCQQGLGVNPQMQDLHNLAAHSLSCLGRYEEVTAEAEAELAISPDSPFSHFLIGRAHWQLREYAKSRQAYLKVIELQPTYTRAYYGLFNVCTRLKQKEEAQGYLEEFKRLDKLDRDEAKRRISASTADLNSCKLSLARLCDGAHELYGKTKDGQRTEMLLKRAVALQPRNINYLEKLVFFYGVTKRVPEALSLCKRIIDIDPNNATCHLNIGKFSMWQQRFDPAERAFQKAIACNPDHFGGYQELARLYLRAKKKPERARELAERAVALQPNAKNYFVLGWACDVTGKPQDAMAALTQAMQLDPSQTKYRQAYESIVQREDSK